MNYPQPRKQETNMHDDDCEDQGMMPTSTCVKFQCQTWSGNVRVQPKLEKRGKFWCCPKCGSSYGADAR